MILNNKILIYDFVKHFNARLSPLDFVLKTKQLSHEYDPRQNQALILPVNDGLIFSQLIKAKYATFIEHILRQIEIYPSCNDIFYSEIETEIMDFYKMFLLQERLKFKIEYNNNNAFMLHTNDMMADLIWSPVSQLHSEIVETYRYFNQFIGAFGGNTKNLFINANAPTAFSCFIQIWVAENLKIPLNGPSNILVV